MYTYNLKETLKIKCNQYFITFSSIQNNVSQWDPKKNAKAINSFMYSDNLS